ncbi:hypothetical protein [uncultured Aquimarina sp.]|uniref:hypothetical protein n=1 Tax=uncultured Aquimarina sp. TaxID=575652 RepID=UPI00262ACD05|nr:hypothetical protein [uncultured Aquimarina sp.]
MLDNLLKINGIQKLHKKKQKTINGGDLLNTDRLACSNDFDCTPQHICCMGTCFNPSIAFLDPGC